MIDPDWPDFDPGVGSGALSLSADRRHVAYRSATAAGADLWIKDLYGTTPPRRLTRSSHEDRAPVFSPSGDTIYFLSSRLEGSDFDVWKVSAAGGEEPLLVHDHPGNLAELAMAADGETLFVRTFAANERDILSLNLTSGALAPVVAEEGVDERLPQVSPSGRFLAYVSNQSGVNEVYIIELGDPDSAPVRVSSAGASQPAWSTTDEELYFNQGRVWTSATLQVDPTPSVLRYDQHWPINDDQAFGWRIGSDARALTIVYPPEQVVLVFHFDRELERLLPN